MEQLLHVRLELFSWHWCEHRKKQGPDVYANGLDTVRVK